MTRALLILPLVFALGIIAGYLIREREQQAALPQQAPVSEEKDVLRGAVKAQVLKVKDGDTFTVRAFLWQGLEKIAVVRLARVNTPEKRKRAGCRRCAGEKKLAAQAEDAAKKLIGARGRGFRPIYLSSVSEGLYGRYVADITTADGVDLGQALIEAGFAKPYDAKKKACWCGIAPRFTD